jgi:hypothetical protein
MGRNVWNGSFCLRKDLNELPDSMKGAIFLKIINDYYLLKKDSAIWN